MTKTSLTADLPSLGLTSRCKFTIGDRVVMTREGQRRLLRWQKRRANTGIVTSHSKLSSWVVNIRVDGRKTTAAYWCGFWKRQP